MSLHKFGVAVLLVFLVVAVIMSNAEEELYSSKYDHINADEVLNTPRLRNQYVKCYLGTGPCRTPDAMFLKEKFPEALVTKCRRCTEKQKEFFSKVTIWFTENEPETWQKVVEKSLKDVQNKN